MAKMYFLDVTKQKSLEKFHKSCNSMADCIENLECHKDKNLTDSKTMRNACETLKFFVTDFFTCLEKIGELKPEPQCFKEWNPFEGFNDKEKNQEELCKNMMGKDNCMKKLVSENCGEEDLRKLYNMFKFAEVFKQCDASKL